MLVFLSLMLRKQAKRKGGRLKRLRQQQAAYKTGWPPFGQTYPDSPLKPIAVLSLAYAYTEAGMTDDARLTFEAFLKDYPDHELSADAKTSIELLRTKRK